MISSITYSQELKPLIFGHRGCRGILPENTLESFNKALEYEIDGIEWDVVVNKDKQLVISHEEYMDKNYCLDPKGNVIKDEKSHSIYRMTQEEIELYDCGTKEYSKFPQQQHFKAHKPLVQEAFDKIDFKGKIILFEIKSEKKLYGKEQPYPEEYVDLILNEVKNFEYKSQIIFMSFDPKILELLNTKAAEFNLVYLHEGIGISPKKMLSQLNFKPYALGIYSKFITSKTVLKAHRQEVKVFAWTVNKDNEFNRLLETKLDGIITDFPNLFGRN
jgi:glycerophosphoryl diester phosphodiesterase